MKKKLFPGNSFSKSDLNCFVSSEYDLKTGGEKCEDNHYKLFHDFSM